MMKAGTSIVEWETGEPKKTGTYLVSINGRFVTTDYWNCLKGRWVYWHSEVTAWCKLEDVKPYKND